MANILFRCFIGEYENPVMFTFGKEAMASSDSNFLK